MAVTHPLLEAFYSYRLVRRTLSEDDGKLVIREVRRDPHTGDKQQRTILVDTLPGEE